MKKIKVIQIIGFVLFLVYVSLFIADFVVGFTGDYREILFWSLAKSTVVFIDAFWGICFFLYTVKMH